MTPDHTPLIDGSCCPWFTHVNPMDEFRAWFEAAVDAAVIELNAIETVEELEAWLEGDA